MAQTSRNSSERNTSCPPTVRRSETVKPYVAASRISQISLRAGDAHQPIPNPPRAGSKTPAISRPFRPKSTSAKHPPLPTPARTGSRQQLTSTLTSQSTLPRPPRGGAPASTMCAAAARSAPPLPFTAPPATPRPRASASSSRAKIPTPPRLHARAAPPGAVGPPRLLEAPTAGPALRARAQPPPRLARRPAAAANRGRPERLGFGGAGAPRELPARRAEGGGAGGDAGER